MGILRTVFLVIFAALLAACTEVGPNYGVETTRPASGSGEVISPSWNVQEVNVVVPRSLTVSEANRYYPTSDIVWRGDQGPDRHAQVEAIFEEAAARATSDLNGRVPVVIDIQVDRFHSLTEKARFSVGGVHNMEFRFGIRNARTGESILEPYDIIANLQAFGGDRAIEADLAGETQKVRVLAYLTEVIADELAKPVPSQPELAATR